jgi:hypothetical protein
MAETSPTLRGEASPGTPGADLMALPWNYAQAVHAVIEGSCRLWARIVLAPAFPPPPHEVESQLEVPDPITAEWEPHLFA